MGDEDVNQVSIPRRLLKPGELCLGFSAMPTTNSHNSDDFMGAKAMVSTLENTNRNQILRSPYQVAESSHLFHKEISSPENGRTALFNKLCSPVNQRSEVEGFHQMENEPINSRTRLFSRAPGTSIGICNDGAFSANAHAQSFSTGYQLFESDIKMQDESKLMSAYTQVERSLFEEKFLLRESILLGCDMVMEIDPQKIPISSEIRFYADCVKDKTIQSKSQNICSNLGHDESAIVSSYLKTFFMLSDVWLEARNCFATNSKCGKELCGLKSRELAKQYVEWMNASRQLLNNIVSGLDEILNASTNKKSNDLVVADKRFQHNSAIATSHMPSHRPSNVGYWEYPPNYQNASSYSVPNVMNGQRPRINVPGNVYGEKERIPMVNNSYEAAGRCRTKSAEENTPWCDYMPPDSYDVERSNITPNKKNMNISQALNNCCITEDTKAVYTVDLHEVASKREMEANDMQYTGSDDGNDDASNMDPDKKSEQSKDIWLLSLVKGKHMVTNGNGCHETESLPRGILDRSKYFEEDTNSNIDGPKRNGYVDQNLRRTTEEAKSGKNGKPLHNKHFNSRRFLTAAQTKRVTEIVSSLWRCELPQYVKYPVRNNQFPDYYKTIKNPIFLESIDNKCKNGIYETVEQFVHDCRRLFLNSSVYSEDNPNEREMIGKCTRLFEFLLRKYFEQAGEWKHIVGDSKETITIPELRYLSSRRRARVPKPTDYEED